MLSELDQFSGQKFKGPARSAWWRFRAGGCHQQRFLLARQLTSGAAARFLAQRPFQICFHEAALGPING